MTQMTFIREWTRERTFTWLVIGEQQYTRESDFRGVRWFKRNGISTYGRRITGEAAETLEAEFQALPQPT